MRKILFVSVHPDDETLGCGGTILRLKDEDNLIFWLNLTSGSLDHPFGFTREQIDKREKTIEFVISRYKFDGFYNLKLPTQMLYTIDTSKFIKQVSDIYHKIEPDILFIPNRSDIHSDHRIAFEALYSAAKNFRSSFIRKILMYETLSETEFAPALAENAFMPNTFVDISDYFEEKLNIMGLYDTEIMPAPLPRSKYAIRALAAYRGSRIGVQYAEAFMLIYNKI